MFCPCAPKDLRTLINPLSGWMKSNVRVWAGIWAEVHLNGVHPLQFFRPSSWPMSCSRNAFEHVQTLHSDISGGWVFVVLGYIKLSDPDIDIYLTWFLCSVLKRKCSTDSSSKHPLLLTCVAKWPMMMFSTLYYTTSMNYITQFY